MLLKKINRSPGSRIRAEKKKTKTRTIVELVGNGDEKGIKKQKVVASEPYARGAINFHKMEGSSGGKEERAS